MRFKNYKGASSARTWSADLLPITTKILIFSVVFEFIILRLLNRMADMFPPWMKGDVTEIIMFLGYVAYNLAFILSILVLFLIANIFWHKKRFLSIFLFTWLPILIGIQILGLAVSSGLSPMIVFGLLMAAVIMIIPVVNYVFRRFARYYFGLSKKTLKNKLKDLSLPFLFIFVISTYLIAYYHHMGNALASMGYDLPNRGSIYRIGEGCALIAAFLAPVAFWRGFRIMNLIPPTIGVLTFAAFALSRPDIVPLVTMWSLGYQLHLFLPLYIIALWCFLFALVNLFRSKDRGSYLVAGLILIFLSGRMLNDFYLIQMAIVGVIFLSLAYDIGSATTSKREPIAKESNI